MSYNLSPSLNLCFSSSFSSQLISSILPIPHHQQHSHAKVKRNCSVLSPDAFSLALYLAMLLCYKLLSLIFPCCGEKCNVAIWTLGGFGIIATNMQNTKCKKIWTVGIIATSSPLFSLSGARTDLWPWPQYEAPLGYQRITYRANRTYQQCDEDQKV